MSEFAILLSGLLAAVSSAVLLRRAWLASADGNIRAALTVGGWAAAGLSTVLFSIGMGFDGGPVVATCVLGVAAYALVAFGVDKRKAKPTREPLAAADPIDPRSRPLRLGRATLRAASAIVLASTASFGLAIAWSLHGAGSAADRVVVAAYVLPLAWGSAITWTLSDDRLSRPIAGLAILTAAGAVLAWWPGAPA